LVLFSAIPTSALIGCFNWCSCSPAPTTADASRDCYRCCYFSLLLSFLFLVKVRRRVTL
jgi:hypothetical protein